jgi:Fur family ferric uptake transcriptional regulator
LIRQNPKKELVYFSELGPSREEYTKKIYGIFTGHLAKHGLRLTDQRRLILDYFLKAERHLSQEDLYATLRGNGVGRATIFRTLKMLEECALISRVVGTSSTPRFELERGRPHHDHLICISCGRIQEVRWPKLEEIQDKTCRKIGFSPRWHRHEIFGLCRDCAGKSKT